MRSSKYIAGIDEAGRGPLAGPVSVGMVVVTRNFDFKQLPLIRDSKKLSEKQREEVFSHIRELAKNGDLIYKVSFGSNTQIDKRGIEHVIRSAIKRLLTVCNPKETQVLLDGRLKAPAEYLNQKTIIRGDSKEPTISLASICAKVLRDKKMLTYAKQYPDYGFEQHKGYGTAAHREAIQKHGRCTIHRQTYTKNID